MPIYEYCCLRCEGQFEELILSPDEEVSCPTCGSKEVKRIISLCAFSSGGKFRPSTSGGCEGCTSLNCSSCKIS